MTLPLVSLINESIDSNVDRRALTYYNGDVWLDVSYGSLKEGINQVLYLLKKNIPDSQSHYILLHLNITLTYPVIVFGVLNAGFGFVCIDADNKNELKKYVEDFKIGYIISNIFFEESHETSFLNNFKFKKNVGLLGETIGLWSTCIENQVNFKFPLFYAIKTSGTTGVAKTVHVTHECIFPNLRDLSEILEVTNTDVIMQMTPVTFDPSVIELFLSIMNGATLCIVQKYYKDNPDLLLDALFPSTGSIVTIMQTTPSLFRRWASSVIKERLFSRRSRLKNLLLGGEEFPSVNELQSWEPSDNINIYNIYGITEVSCWASIHKVWPAKDIEMHIGKSLSETMLQLKTTKKNEDEGELLIGSKTRKSLLNDETVESIFLNNEAIFRATGDIFKEVNGKLYFKRRKDGVIKRWGIKFSLSSIEQIAKLHENISACSCVSLKTDYHIRIGLFVVVKSCSDLKEFKSFLKKSLPKAAWPDTIVSVDALPLTSHGKICLQTLKKMLFEEKKIITKDKFYEMWLHYSSENSTGKNDFFLDGGDSLTALQLVSELKLIYNDLPDTILGMIFGRKTFLEIWSYLQNYKGNTSLITTNQMEIDLPEETIKSGNENVLRMVFKGKIMVYGIKPSLYDAIPKKFELKESWKKNLGKCIDASPLGIKLRSGRNICIIGSHSGMVAVIDIDSGKSISDCKLPDRVESSACISDNAESYYIGCYDGCLYSISIKSGIIEWKYQTGDLVKCACTIVDDCIIFGSYDRNIYCLYKDGSLKWKTVLRSPISAEILSNNHCLFSVTLGSVASLNINNGKKLWEIVHEPVFSTPVLSNDFLIIAGVSGRVQWLNSKNGTEECAFQSDDMIFSSLVTYTINEKEILIFGCQDGFVYCLKNRQLHWKTYLDSRVVSTPFVEFGEDSNGIIICTTTKGTVYILNLSIGEKVVQYSLPGEVFSSPILLNGRLIVGCRDDHVYCLDIK